MFFKKVINLKQSTIKYNLKLLNLLSLFRFSCRNAKSFIIDFNVINDSELCYIFNFLLLLMISIETCIKVEFIINFFKKFLNNSEKRIQLN